MGWPKGKTGPRRGAILTKEHKLKIKTKLKEYYSTHPGPATGRVPSAEMRKKLSDRNKITSKGNNHIRHGWERILAEVPELEKQGFKVFPITSAIPDIVAIKDGKLYIIEVEYNKPNYSKYTPEIKKYADEVIWILRGSNLK